MRDIEAYHSYHPMVTQECPWICVSRNIVKQVGSYSKELEKALHGKQRKFGTEVEQRTSPIKHQMRPINKKALIVENRRN